jgi:hypothetical protein
MSVEFFKVGHTSGGPRAMGTFGQPECAVLALCLSREVDLPCNGTGWHRFSSDQQPRASPDDRGRVHHLYKGQWPRLRQWAPHSPRINTRLRLSRSNRLSYPSAMDHIAHQETRNEEVERLMEGRDTRWYRGCLLKLTCCCFLALITSA